MQFERLIAYFTIEFNQSLEVYVAGDIYEEIIWCEVKSDLSWRPTEGNLSKTNPKK